ncbi:hypothetical protein HDU92_007734, partial [Lobulomyces angularis]
CLVDASQTFGLGPLVALARQPKPKNLQRNSLCTYCLINATRKNCVVDMVFMRDNFLCHKISMRFSHPKHDSNP